MARCSACGGTGKRLIKTPAGLVTVETGEPCQICQGSGTEHCCEGERCQPESQSGNAAGES